MNVAPKMCRKLISISQNITGITGTVFLLGGTQNEVYDVITQQLSTFKTDEELQNGVVMHIISLIKGKEIDGLQNTLKNCRSWEDKLDETIEALEENIAFSMQYVKVVIDTAYSRLKQIQNHKQKATELRSKVVVLRASDMKSDKKQQTLSKVAYRENAFIKLIISENRLKNYPVSNDIKSNR